MPRALLHLTRRGASWWALSRVGSSYHASWHDAGDPRVTFRVSIRADLINLIDHFTRRRLRPVARARLGIAPAVAPRSSESAASRRSG